jgi:hypothetical protein
MGAALTLVLLPVSEITTWGWKSWQVIACCIGAAASTVLWGVVEFRAARPLIDLRIFFSRSVLAVNAAGLLLGFAIFCQFIGVPSLVQVPAGLGGDGFGASVQRAVLEFMLPGSIVAAIMAPIGGYLASRIGAKATLVVGAALGLAAFLTLAVLSASEAGVFGACIVAGSAWALVFAAFPAMIVGIVSPQDTSMLIGINAIARTVGGSLASALIASVLAAALIQAGGSAVPTPERGAFTTIFALGAGACVLAVLVALSMAPTRRLVRREGGVETA